MCRSTINIGDEGEVFDCDFNQMLRMQQRNQGKPLYRWDVTSESMAPPTIASDALRTLEAVAPARWKATRQNPNAMPADSAAVKPAVLPLFSGFFTAP